MKYLLFFFLILVSSSQGYQNYLGKTDEGVDIFKIDLNQKPRERFKAVTQHYKQDILNLAQLYEEVINEAIQYMFSMLELVTIESDSPYYQEMEGIAEVLGRSTHEVMMLNYLYELDAYCTSIVTRLNNGSIILARNLDFYFPNETRKILYIGKFYRGE